MCVIARLGEKLAMASENSFSFRITSTLFTVAMVATFGMQLRAQNSAEQKAPYIDDWTHHRLVFSNPGTQQDAARQGKLQQWQQTTSDPR